MAASASSLVDEARLWRRHKETEEGGARVPTGPRGLMVIAGRQPPAAILNGTDDAGISVGDALRLTREALADLPERPLGFPLGGFVGAHIEQGPELEATGNTIGI